MLVYGKHFLKPYIPTDLWGFIIMLAKQYHNYIGPIFYVLLLGILIKWWRKSIPSKVDLQWMLKLGGMAGKHKAVTHLLSSQTPVRKFCFGCSLLSVLWWHSVA
ncbi:formate dehydrogenase -O gamma subunit [Vibrio astriarenae]|nr:formate dehydrogenase -O gamma subunit [Vibrio sp. C7]